MAMNPRLLRPTANDSPASIPGLALWLDASASDALYTTDAGPVSAVSSPLDIGGCQLWLDASDAASITASSGEVTAWADKSPTGSSWTRVSGVNGPATGTQTMGGKNVVVFDGVDDGLSAVTPLSTSLPMSFFIVQRIVSATSFGMSYVSGAGSDDFNVRQSGTSGRLNIVAENGIVLNETSGASRAGIDDIVSWVVPSSTNSSLFRGGSGLTLDSATLKPVLSGTHYIGRRSDGFYLNGYIAEIIVYNTALSTSDRARVEAYLAAKWGISGVHAPAATASDPVGYWRDRSGNGRHATQSTAASRPVVGTVNSRKALTFDGSNDFLSADGAATVFNGTDTPWTVMAALDMNATTENSMPWTASRSDANAGRYLTRVIGGQWNVLATDDAFASKTVASGGAVSLNPATLAITCSGTDVSIASNGAVTLSGGDVDLGARTANKFTVAANFGASGPAAYASVTALELLTYSRALSTAERRKVERYLARRWGITLAPQVSNAEAQDWVNRVYTNGGTVSQSTASAVSSLCDSLEAAGIRDRFFRLNLFCGDNLNAALVPLYRGPTFGGTTYGNATDTNNAFVGVGTDYAETGASGGLTGNGTSKYLNTGLSVNDIGTFTSGHLSVYHGQSSGTNVDRYYIATNDATTSNRFRLGTQAYSTAVALGIYGSIWSASESLASQGHGAAGHRTLSRTSATSLTHYHNGSVVATNTTDATGGGALSTAAFPVFCFNNNGSFSGFHNSWIAAYSIGLGLDSTQEAAYRTAMQAFQTALGRNV